MYIKVAGQGILIINRQKEASDLLDRRGQIYGGRPRYIGKRSLRFAPIEVTSNYSLLGNSLWQPPAITHELIKRAVRPRCVLSLIFRYWLKPMYSFRRMHRIAHDALSKTRVAEFHDTHTKEAVILTDEMLRDPLNWAHNFHR